MGESAVNEGKSVGNVGEPVENAGQPVENAGEPVENAEKPVENAGESVEDAEKPAVNAGEPVENEGKPAENVEEPVENAEKSVVNAGEPVENVGKFVGNAGESVENAGQSAVNVGESVENAEKSVVESAGCAGKQGIEEWLSAHEEELVQTARYIFEHPETAYQEKLSSQYLARYLENQGFKITYKTAGIETAFSAVWEFPDKKEISEEKEFSRKRPVVGFLAEYDALAEIGHACGHNLLGTAVCAAACALKADMEKNSTPGILRVYGCPAEEIMSGKIVMNEQGVFDDLDVAVTWHPFDRNRVSNDIWQSQDIKNYIFHGVSAHASKSPETGRSALDGAELMNIGVNYLREHVPGDVRMHYAYVDNGIPANVVPDYAETNYFIRSSKRARTDDVSRRVDDCARGAAMMTGTSVDIKLIAGCKEMKVNRVLAEIYYEAMTHIPVPEYTEEEIKFAKRITEEAKLSNGGIYFTGLEPLEDEPVPISIGTDAAEVSHTVPLITLSAAAMCRGTPLHHPAAAEQAGMSIGHKGMMYAARCMAEGTKLLLKKPENLQKAWQEHLGTGENPV